MTTLTPTIPKNAGSFGPIVPKGGEKSVNRETKQPSQSHTGRQEMAETQRSLLLLLCLQAGNASHSAILCVLYSGSLWMGVHADWGCWPSSLPKALTLLPT